MTAPFCLAIVVLAALILGLVEAARLEGLRVDATEWTNLALESMFAGYQPVLLEEYGMFFFDGGYGTGEWELARAQDEMEVLLRENLVVQDKADGVYLYGMEVSDVEVAHYQLATDGDGDVFAKQAAKTMKQKIGEDAAKNILNGILDLEGQRNKKIDPEQSMKNANKKMEELEALAAEQKKEPSLENGTGEAAQIPGTEPAEDTRPKEEVAAPENPLETVKQIKKQGILMLVMPRGKTISGNSMPVDNCLMKRKCKKGNVKKTASPGWYERILMQEFIKTHAGNAVSPNESGALAYGTEYLIGGKGSDEENLKRTVTKLLLMREVANFLYLQTDEIKKAEALSVATAIAAALGAPPAAVVIQEGILAAWAYAESICDVKALLAGGKIPLVKTADIWRTQLSNLADAAVQEPDTKTGGCSYEQYLDALLYSQSVKKVAYRSMDLMEQRLRREKGCESCRMDYMLFGADISAEYDAGAIFSSFFGTGQNDGYSFVRQAAYDYD